MRKFLWALAGVLSMTLAASAASAASFDCATARSPTETAICGNDTLSDLDDEMAEYYDELSFLLDDDEYEELEEEQAEWLRERDRCGGRVSCIERAYERRIDELLDWLDY